MIKLFCHKRYSYDSPQEPTEMSMLFWTFPGGERNVKLQPGLPDHNDAIFMLEMTFHGSNDLIDMPLIVNALRHEYGSNAHISLSIPYFPFARQDRVMTPGEPFALQVVVDLIKMCKFEKVYTIDPHSDVLAGMFDAGTLSIMTQDVVWAEDIRKIACEVNSGVYLVSPDAGAQKKIFKLGKNLGLSVVTAEKIRNVSTGEILSTKIEVPGDAQRLIVVDDICDGGRTFIELAKEIRKQDPDIELVLCVTHGIFSKGIEVLNECYDKVLFKTDLRKE